MMNLYLEELGKEYKESKLLLIMDQAGWHRSKDLKIPSNIKIIFLPPYSPELNPVEKLWFWLKKEVTHNRVYMTINDLMNALEKEFQKLTDWQMLNLCYCNYL